MKRKYVESPIFTKKLDKLERQDLKDEVEAILNKDPEAGDIMEGCGGIRKLRVSDSRRGKGKRGGHRVLYIDIRDAQTIHLLSFYDKNEKLDISAEEKKFLKQIAKAIKEET